MSYFHDFFHHLEEPELKRKVGFLICCSFNIVANGEANFCEANTCDMIMIDLPQKQAIQQ